LPHPSIAYDAIKYSHSSKAIPVGINAVVVDAGIRAMAYSARAVGAMTATPDQNPDGRPAATPSAPTRPRRPSWPAH
jgi:hypothetical protein